jgi:hypothetical protein
MSKFEWVELESLSAAVTHLQSRIEAARGTKNYGLVQLLEKDLAAAMVRRSRVLADITVGVSNAPRSGARPVEPLAHGPQPEEPDAKQERAGTIETHVSQNILSITSPENPSARGNLQMWDKLTAADVERVKRGVATRRAEMLARHAEELKALETERTEIEAVDKAIAVFTQKFKVTTA